MISVLPPDAEASGAGAPFAEATHRNSAPARLLEEPVILERRNKQGMRPFFMVHCESNRPLVQ